MNSILHRLFSRKTLPICSKRLFHTDLLQRTFPRQWAQQNICLPANQYIDLKEIDSSYLSTNEFGEFENHVLTTSLKTCTLLVIQTPQKLFGFHYSTRLVFDENAMKEMKLKAKDFGLDESDFEFIDKRSFMKAIEDLGEQPTEIMLIPSKSKEYDVDSKSFVKNPDIQFLLELLCNAFDMNMEELIGNVTIFRGVEAPSDVVLIEREKKEVFNCQWLEMEYRLLEKTFQEW